MKKLILLLIFLIPVVYSQAQFKNLGKKLEKKVKNRVERKVDRTMDKGLDKAEQGVDDATRMEKKDKESDKTGNTQSNSSGNEQSGDEFGSASQNGSGSSNEFGTGSTEGNFSDSFATDRNFDFVPGNTLRLTDNFERDNVGDFPSKWDTNGSGEVVTSGVDGSKWFLIRTGSVYIPMIGDPMTEEYTIEFDLALQGIDNKTSSVAKLTLKIEDHNSYNRGRNFASVALPLGQYGVFGTTIVKVENGQNVLRNNVQMDIRNALLNKPHISVAVNKSRFRMWINENKIVDVPRLVPYEQAKYIKFELGGLQEGENVYISNVKIAEGGLDLRSQLIRDGKVSTTGILFNVNSSTVKTESYGVIREIALAMQSNPGINVNIIGHTDSDGDDSANLELSKARAESVKQILIKDFNISANRLMTDGKGESEPVADNSSPEKKASNRRVEFIVQN